MKQRLFMLNLCIFVISTHGIVVSHMMESYNNNWKNLERYTIYKRIASWCIKTHCIMCTNEFQSWTTVANKREKKNLNHFDITIFWIPIPFEILSLHTWIRLHVWTLWAQWPQSTLGNIAFDSGTQSKKSTYVCIVKIS